MQATNLLSVSKDKLEGLIFRSIKHITLHPEDEIAVTKYAPQVDFIRNEIRNAPKKLDGGDIVSLSDIERLEGTFLGKNQYSFTSGGKDGNFWGKNEEKKNLERLYKKYFGFTQNYPRIDDPYNNKSIYFHTNDRREMNPYSLEIVGLKKRSEHPLPYYDNKESDLICGYVQYDQHLDKRPKYTEWFICSQQFYKMWLLIMYGEQYFETILLKQSINKRGDNDIEYVDVDALKNMKSMDIKRWLFSGNRLTSNTFKKWYKMQYELEIYNHTISTYHYLLEQKRIETYADIDESLYGDKGMYLVLLEDINYDEIRGKEPSLGALKYSSKVVIMDQDFNYLKDSLIEYFKDNNYSFTKFYIYHRGNYSIGDYISNANYIYSTYSMGKINHVSYDASIISDDAIIDNYYHIRTETFSRHYCHIYACIVLLVVYGEFPTTLNMPKNLNYPISPSMWDIPPNFVEDFLKNIETCDVHGQQYI
jgi:hypothetical protein